jgi:hypothetical protein
MMQLVSDNWKILLDVHVKSTHHSTHVLVSLDRGKIHKVYELVIGWVLQKSDPKELNSAKTHNVIEQFVLF